MVFSFVQKNFFGQHESYNIYFFLSHKARIFFPEFNIRLYDNNSESDFFFPPPKSEYFFQQHWESEYIFFLKNHTPTPTPWKLSETPENKKARLRYDNVPYLRQHGLMRFISLNIPEREINLYFVNSAGLIFQSITEVIVM